MKLNCTDNFLFVMFISNRLQNISKKGAAKNCGLSTLDLSKLCQRCTISCSPFARSKCKLCCLFNGY